MLPASAVLPVRTIFCSLSLNQKNLDILLGNYLGLIKAAKICGKSVPKWRVHHQLSGRKDLVLGKEVEVVNDGGTIEIGQRCSLLSGYQRLRLKVGKDATLTIGDDCILESVIIAASTSVSIGKACRLGPFVHIMDSDFHDLHDRSLPGPTAPIHINDGVTLGARVIVLRGVTIGSGTQVLPGSVVTKDLPAGVFAAGVPEVL
ncbi:MAG: acyltransferase [Saprospiraceae bacterium]